VGGCTLLEISLIRLREFGVREVIVNAHHFAEMIGEYLQANHNFGMRIEISCEDELLDTGGGLKKAAHFFMDAGSLQEPFILHNVDVISTIDLEVMARFHVEQKALATLAVQKRESSRYLLFDEQGLLCGRQTGRDGKVELARNANKTIALGFSGIHILSTELLTKISEEGAFSIISTYMRLAAEGERIVAHRVDDCSWRDLGKPESILAAERESM
jgi:NDP-sugar pyrophosphorylase family protein